MGGDKLLLEVGGVPLLRRVHDTLSVRCAEIVVVGEGGGDLRLEGVRRIPDERRGVAAVVPRNRGRTHPLCAAYDRETLPDVRAALDGGVRSVREFLQGLDAVEYVEEGLRRFGEPDLFLMNVNSPEDLERARASCTDSR
jgi:molybdenum cofactor guanylyltransferase